MPQSNTTTDPSDTETSVLYNAECSVCRFEIDHYAQYTEARALPIGFEDLNVTDLERWGLTADQAARRLHVRQGDTLLSGVPAFIALWSQMPRYRWLARLVSLPGIQWLACTVYDHALAPILYHRQRHRYASAEKSGNTPSAR